MASQLPNVFNYRTPPRLNRAANRLLANPRGRVRKDWNSAQDQHSPRVSPRSPHTSPRVSPRTLGQPTSTINAGAKREAAGTAFTYTQTRLNEAGQRRLGVKDVERAAAFGGTGGTSNHTNCKLVRRRSIQDLMVLLGKTHFNMDELEVVAQQFQMYSSSMDTKGVLDRRAFKRAMGYFNFLTGASRNLERMFRAFDTEGTGVVCYREFVMGMSIYIKGTMEEKVAFLIRLFDSDSDGYIDEFEFVNLLRTSYIVIGEAMDDPAVSELKIARIIDKLEFGPNGKLPIEDMSNSIAKIPELTRLLMRMFGA